MVSGYGVSHEAVLTLFDALIAGHGTMAQFSHPELGGMGQWTRGGMIMIGDLFNSALRAKVNDLCRELANLVSSRQVLGVPGVPPKYPNAAFSKYLIYRQPMDTSGPVVNIESLA